ncbi:MAG TPA: RlmE family RNA methyltransferase [Paracoccaceae bacterium]|nr:RlmE family RNA methyltransferase [Paracoccaceae bacterium]
MAPRPPGRDADGLKVRVRTAKKRRHSSTLWLARQLNDPYVQRARREGFRARSAYKLMEIDDRFHFLTPGARVVDLGCAPGGWSQVAVARVNALGERPGRPRGRVVGIDLLAAEPVPGAEMLALDFLAEGADARLRELVGGRGDVVMSDMAPPTVGHRQTDHLRIVALAEAAAAFAFEMLAPGGTFLCKVWAGGAEGSLQAELKRRFAKVVHVKPPASRSDSAEKFVVAMGFRGTSSPAG